MSLDDNIKEAGARLARDMRAIRTARSVSHDAIVRVTKAAPNVLEEFERTALVGNPMYNRVYLRLFMRGYAEVIGIRPDDALRAADEMLQGQYTDRLARLYLELPEDESADSDSELDAAAPAVDAGKQGRKQKEATPTETGTGAAPAGLKAASAGAPQPPSSSSVKKSDTSSASGAAEKSESTGSAPGAPARAPYLKPPGKTVIPPRTGGGPPSLPGNAAAVIAGVVIVVLLALAAWFFWPEGDASTPAPVEPLTEETISTPVPQLPPRIVLGDTTSFFVIAARDTLNPIRVTVDGGIRTPHWIELGDSMEFRVADQIVLEMRLNAVDVSVNDVLLPTTGRDAARRLVLTKEFAQAHLDSLRTAAGPVGSAPGNE